MSEYDIVGTLSQRDSRGKTTLSGHFHKETLELKQHSRDTLKKSLTRKATISGHSHIERLSRVKTIFSLQKPYPGSTTGWPSLPWTWTWTGGQETVPPPGGEGDGEDIAVVVVVTIVAVASVAVVVVAVVPLVAAVLALVVAVVALVVAVLAVVGQETVPPPVEEGDGEDTARISQ